MASIGKYKKRKIARDREQRGNNGVSYQIERNLKEKNSKPNIFL